jgi:hypothetical protein
MPVNQHVADMIASARLLIVLDQRYRGRRIATARCRHPDLILRDVGELKDVGMVPNAFHAPRGMIEFWADPDSPYHKSIFHTDKEVDPVLRLGSALGTGCAHIAGYGNGQCSRHGRRRYRVEDAGPSHGIYDSDPQKTRRSQPGAGVSQTPAPSPAAWR